MAEISVILPFFNAEPTIAKAIESVLSQTFSDFKLILVDNASEDRSWEIARNFQEKDHRIQLLQEKRKGVVFAFAKGFAAAQSPYIARMDSDDTAHPDRLLKQYHFLKKNPEVGLLATRVKYKGNQEGFQFFVDWSNAILEPKDIGLSRFIEFPIVNPSIMFPRKVAEDNGIYKEGDFPEDYEMFLRWMENGVKVAKLKEELMEWNDLETRLTRTDPRYSTESFFKIKSRYLFQYLKKVNPFFPNVVIWGAGKKSRARLKFLEELGINVLYFIDLKADKTSTKKCISFKHITSPGKVFIISYVANRGAGDEIRNFLNSRNYVEGRDFILAG
ncbi:glycosyltransferase family 2 protein [Flexithrix dorotheae]|uniref:glycosyltransferase family 2 protein n=1 Tax=Flexithrix dorotheae TaxID=70993 RepID=UPI00037AAD65|nr:glycosyltransferase family 2 protein [Flexithrix dorotheae]